MSQEPCTLFCPRNGFDADAAPADIAGDHGEIRHAHHHRGSLAVLGHAQAVVDRRVAAGRIEPGGARERRPPARPVTAFRRLPASFVPRR